MIAFKNVVTNLVNKNLLLNLSFTFLHYRKNANEVIAGQRSVLMCNCIA